MVVHLHFTLSSVASNEQDTYPFFGLFEQSATILSRRIISISILWFSFVCRMHALVWRKYMGKKFWLVVLFFQLAAAAVAVAMGKDRIS